MWRAKRGTAAASWTTASSTRSGTMEAGTPRAGPRTTSTNTYANIPDVFFHLAKKYTVTVIEDAAESPTLALLFGSQLM